MNFAPMVVNFLGIKVNVLEHESSFTIGPFFQMDTFVSEKRNYGFGEENGDLILVNIPISAVTDSDLIDAASVKNSVV
jgi:hypothetical protein